MSALPDPAGFGNGMVTVVAAFCSIAVATCCTSVGVAVATSVVALAGDDIAEARPSAS
jgi:hypothetical protein